MDFYDLLKEAAKNKEKAENELQDNKRFNLNFRPKKLPRKQKVDRAAIAARLKKKEEEEKRQAEIEEKKRQEVLALRAEQEAAKSAARKRKGSSSSLKHQTKPKAERDPREGYLEEGEPSPPKREKVAKVKKEKPPKKDKYEDYLFKKRHAEEEARSRNAKDTKGQGFTFKQLMDIAAANAGITKTDAAGKEDKCPPNVKLKSAKDGGLAGKAQSEARVAKSGERESHSVERRKQEDRKKVVDLTKDKPVSRSGKTVLEKHKSTAVLGQKKQHDSGHDRHNSKISMQKERNQTDRVPSTPRPPKSTCFPNTKAFHDPDGVRKNSSHEGRKSELERRDTPRGVGGAPKSNPKRPSDGTIRSKDRTRVDENGISAVENGRPSHHPPKRKAGSSSPTREPQKKPNSIEKVRNEKPMHHPVKRKGGWLDPVKKSPDREVGPKVVKNETQMHHPAKKKGGWLDPVNRPGSNGGASREENSTTKKVIKASKEKTVVNGARGDQPKPKKGGWLDPQSAKADRTISPKKERVVKSSAGPPVPKARQSGGSKISRAEAPAKQKRGWLDAEDPPPPPRQGGWLGPARVPSHSKSGGWLGPSRMPSWQAKGGRLLSSEEEDEDSDLDGFIDDEPLDDEPASVSSYIKEIFGYDKSKYKDESDYALRSMESSYSQMMKEEARSARIAQKEDAEEWRKEKEREKMKKLAAAKGKFR